LPRPAAKPIILGIGFLLAAWLLWEVRDVVPSWAAQSVVATINLATTTERDDSRAWLRLPPYTPILDLERRPRCRDCDAKGKPVVAIRCEGT